MNINRDYIVRLFMAEAGANRGKVIALLLASTQAIDTLKIYIYRWIKALAT